MLAKVQKALILHTFLVGWYNGTATLENSLVVFKKKKQIFLSYDLSTAPLGTNTLG